MKTNKKIVTKTSATGTVVADFDMARFVIKATEVGNTGKQAKENIKSTVEKLNKLYKKYKAENFVESLKTGITVQLKNQWNKLLHEQEHVGYEAEYTMIFHAVNLDKVSQIHDEFSNIDNVQVDQPTFDLRDKTELSKKAFEKAFEKCQERFKFECSVLGLNHKHYGVSYWDTRYSEDERYHAYAATVSNAFNQDNEAIEIRSGKAEVSCNLSITYELL